MSRLATALLLAMGALALAGRTRAEPLPESTRRRAEDAFVRGRIEDLEAILGTGKEPVDFEPIAVRDLFWRPGGPTSIPRADDGSLSSRRIDWLLNDYIARVLTPGSPTRREPYPMPGPGAVDPYPRLTALVLDRLRREERGADGLPEESPVSAVPDENLRAFQSWYARRAFRGGRPEDLSPEERAAEDALTSRLRTTADRNRILGLGAVAALVLAALVVGWRLGPRRDSPGPGS